MASAFGHRLVAWGLFAFTIAFVLWQIARRTSRGERSAHREREGYWSPVTSNIDWCEPNYLVSPFVAEPWNSASSCVLVLTGVYILRKAHRHGMRWPCWLQGFNVVSIGVGSVLFHGTLTQWAQWMDELPMFAATLVAAAAYYGGTPGRPAAQVWMYCGVWTALVLAVVVGLLLLPREIGASIFQVAFICSVLEMIRGARQYSGVIRNNADLAHLTVLLDCALWSGAIAGLAWAVDIAACDAQLIARPPFLGLSPHVVWHFAVAHATHSLGELGTFAIAGDAARRSMGTDLHFALGFVPVLGGAGPEGPWAPARPKKAQ